MKESINKRRRVVEIYFILYLAALIFILPDEKKEAYLEETDMQKTLTSTLAFQIKPSKTTLNSIVIIDTAGPKILSVDSINSIYVIGNAKSVKYEFFIRDLYTGSSFNISDTATHRSDFFRIYEDSRAGEAQFIWQPPLKDLRSRTYLVNVIAYIEDAEDSSEVKLETQFSLNVNIITSEGTDLATLQMLSKEIEESVNPVPPPFVPMQVSTSKISLFPQDPIVSSIAYREWQTTVFVAGMNLSADLLKNPTIDVFQDPDGNRGTAKITDITDSYLTLSGTTPGFGSMKVKVGVVRSHNRDEASTEFTVVPQSLREPIYPSIMYPEITYRIKPELPFISGKSAFVRLTDGIQIYLESKDANEIVFTPTHSDTGKTIFIERYVDSQLLDGKSPMREYKIEVNSFPPPEIARIQLETTHKVRIYTISYGKYRGKENFITDFQISGNAKLDREIFGLLKTNETTLAHSQVFDIIPKDKTKPFTFEISAINDKKQESRKVKYP